MLFYPGNVTDLATFEYLSFDCYRTLDGQHYSQPSKQPRGREELRRESLQFVLLQLPGVQWSGVARRKEETLLTRTLRRAKCEQLFHPCSEHRATHYGYPQRFRSGCVLQHSDCSYLLGGSGCTQSGEYGSISARPTRREAPLCFRHANVAHGRGEATAGSPEPRVCGKQV